MSVELYGSHHDQYAEMYHYGVKGMKWGVRRKREKTGVTRKQNRQMNREARDKFDREMVDRAVKASAKDSQTLVQMKAPGMTHPLVVTGKQFTEHLMLGGAVDSASTRVWATRNSSGSYEQSPDALSYYKKKNYRYKD